MMVFKKDNWVILLYTVQLDGADPLVYIAGLEKLARLVADRL